MLAEVETTPNDKRKTKQFSETILCVSAYPLQLHTYYKFFYVHRRKNFPSPAEVVLQYHLSLYTLRIIYSHSFRSTIKNHLPRSLLLFQLPDLRYLVLFVVNVVFLVAIKKYHPHVFQYLSVHLHQLFYNYITFKLVIQFF